MSISYTIYLDTPVAPSAMECLLQTSYGYTKTFGDSSRNEQVGLAGAHGIASIEGPGSDDSGPHIYKHRKTLSVNLDPNKQSGAESYIFRLAGDILALHPGDATIESSTDGPILLRLDSTLWVIADPFIIKHVFSGLLRRDIAVVGLPDRSSFTRPI